MAQLKIKPTGSESPFSDEDLIVSKTDLKGRLTYTNDVFLRVSRFTPKEVIGEPHSIIRHPDMPRSIFKLLWDTIQEKKEIFAYVVNLAKNGDHYWVFAHVTPSLDGAGNVVGFHSNRRKPNPGQVTKIKELYSELLAEENRHADRKAGMVAAYDKLMTLLASKKVSYDEFVFAI